MWFDDKRFIPPSPFQISHVVAQCIVLSRQDPCTGNIAVLFRMKLLHPIVCMVRTMCYSIKS